MAPPLGLYSVCGAECVLAGKAAPFNLTVVYLFAWLTFESILWRLASQWLEMLAIRSRFVIGGTVYSGSDCRADDDDIDERGWSGNEFSIAPSTSCPERPEMDERALRQASLNRPHSATGDNTEEVKPSRMKNGTL